MRHVCSHWSSFGKTKCLSDEQRNSAKRRWKPSWNSPESVRSHFIMERRSLKRIAARSSVFSSEGCLQRFPSDNPCPHWTIEQPPRAVRTRLYISTEVYNEVVIAGAGMPGSSAVSRAEWIRVSAVHDTEALADAMASIGLGAGETSAVQLAKELGIELVLMDEWRGRRLAKQAGLAVVDSGGALSSGHSCRSAASLSGTP